jgi:hypothetical protein
MEEILLFLRTSLRKHPEEWVFAGQHPKSGTFGFSLNSSMVNVFIHEPTNHVLMMIEAPENSHVPDGELKIKYYVQLMDEEEYTDEVETIGIFSPDVNFLYQVNENSSIIKTLKFIKYIEIEDEKLLKYENFKGYVIEKLETEKLEKEAALNKKRGKKGRKKNGKGDNISG